jgi:preprotein translocase subunit SecG
MFSIFLVLIVIVCFLLIVVVMVQNPKGGGLSSTLGGSQQMGGVQKTTDFLDKSTWTLGVLLIVLIMFSSLSFNSTSTDVNILNDKQVAPTKTQMPAPVAPTTPATELPTK